MLKRKIKQGFTLAEVLITLGIIGVVAAMTIPTLIQDYNTRVWNTGAKVFERKLEEALKTMNSQSSLAGHTTTESFVDELSKHFKTNKICQNNELLDCFNNVIYWGAGEATPEEVDMAEITKAKNFGQDDWDTNIISVQFANGVSAMIAYNPTSSCTQDPYSNQVTGGDCLAILYDTSGAKNPNTSGKDIRSNGKVTSLGSGCFARIDSLCVSQITTLQPGHVWNGCKEDGTSDDSEDNAFMAKYNIPSCLKPSQGSVDYWASAVESCGGTNKVASVAQLNQLANYLYNTSGIGDSSYYGSLDTTKAEALGLPGRGFVVLSGKEDPSYGVAKSVLSKGFTSSEVYTAYGLRNFNGHYVICVGE